MADRRTNIRDGKVEQECQIYQIKKNIYGLNSAEFIGILEIYFDFGLF